MYHYKTIILIINIVSIFFLIGLSILLLCIKRNNKRRIVPHLIVITTTIPFYLYNIFFHTEQFKWALWTAPFAYSAGLAFLPALWIAIHQYFNSQTPFSKIRLFHFFPSLVCFIIYTAYIHLLSYPEKINFFVYKNTLWVSWIESLNITVLISQVIIYFSIILLYMHKVKQFIGKNYTFAEWQRSLWIPRLISAITIAFLVLLLCHHIVEHNWSWTLNLFDIVIILYFVYNATNFPFSTHDEYVNKAITAIQFDYEISKGRPISINQAKEISNATFDYLATSRSYLNPALTIKEVADAIGYSPNQISQALEITDNTHFTIVVNKMRIDRAVKVLNNDVHREQNIDSLTFQSGFTSREAFFTVFKSIMGKTPTEFLLETTNDKSR